MHPDTKTRLHLACSSVCVVLAVIVVILIAMRINATFRIATASASEKTISINSRNLPIFIYERSKGVDTPAQVAMDYQLQANLFILRNGFLTGTPAVTACVESACKAAYTLAQLKAGVSRNAAFGHQASLLSARPLH